jgi:hypothetical protein
MEMYSCKTHAPSVSLEGFKKITEGGRKRKEGREVGEMTAPISYLLLNSADVDSLPRKPQQPLASRMSQRKRSFTFGAYGG